MCTIDLLICFSTFKKEKIVNFTINWNPEASVHFPEYLAMNLVLLLFKKNYNMTKGPRSKVLIKTQIKKILLLFTYHELWIGYPIAQGTFATWEQMLGQKKSEENMNIGSNNSSDIIQLKIPEQYKIVLFNIIKDGVST